MMFNFKTKLRMQILRLLENSPSLMSINLYTLSVRSFESIFCFFNRWNERNTATANEILLEKVSKVLFLTLSSDSRS